MRSLKYLRSVLQISARELAREAALSEREIRRIESADVTPRRSTAAGLDRAFAAITRRRLIEALVEDGADA